MGCKEGSSEEAHRGHHGFFESQEAASADPRAANLLLKSWASGVTASERRGNIVGRVWGKEVGDQMYIK